MESLPKLSASRSKAEFFRHLGLSEDDENHKALYAKMMEEAALGRQRTCQNRDNLTPQSRADPHVAPPYSSSQITETARHREVQNIYYSASNETRKIYDRGLQKDGSNWDNWIIRWCLWHVFRYRDDRNRHRGYNARTYTRSYHRGPRPVASGVQEVLYDEEPGTASTQNGPYASTTQTRYYDPVRDSGYGY